MPHLFETLESRRLMAAQAPTEILTNIIALPNGVFGANLSGSIVENPAAFNGSAYVTKTGTLVITGTAAADKIYVVRDGNKLQYQAFATNDHWIVTVEAFQIKRILVEAGAGDDKVFIDPAITKPVTIAGGSGNDTIDGNDNCTLIGGAGNDHLFASANSILNGGDGNDTLVGVSTDSLAGGAGYDLAILLNADRALFGSDGGDSVYGTVGVIVRSDGTVGGEPLFAQRSSIERFNIAPTPGIEFHLPNP